MFPVENNKSLVEIQFTENMMRRVNGTNSWGLKDARNHFAKHSLEDLRIHYVSGHCGVLATVIHQLTGWPVYRVCTLTYPHTVLPRYIGGKLCAGAYSVKGGWCCGLHAVVKNPITNRFIDAYGANQTWRQITRKYREGIPKGYYSKVGMKRDSRIDLFKRSPEDYTLCLLDHVDRMLPEFSPLVAQWRLQEGIEQPAIESLAA